MDISKIEETKKSLLINSIRMLSVDMVDKANSGHPGMPMEFADTAFTLWMEFLNFNPKDPKWPNRDRFILSSGHGSALIYSLLHLFGFNLSIEELKRFRQLDSKTPGHPEYGHTEGVEVTTGPLGQGIVNGVGMALAERVISEKFNKFGDIIDHHTYCVVSDGDLMEGVSGEGASFAGHLGLSKLICIYTSNSISIEGSTDIAFTEDVGKRFEAYGWQVLNVNGYNLPEISNALNKAKSDTKRPSIIIATTNIGKGSPNKQDKAAAHGEPLGEAETKLTKEAFGWPADKTFYVPKEAKALAEERVLELKETYDKWTSNFNKLMSENSDFKELWDQTMNKKIPADIEKDLLETIKPDPIATRSASGNMLQVVAGKIPGLIGGSADLAPSNKTAIKDSASITKNDFSGKNIHFGVREHSMGSILNGMAVYGGLIPFGATFLVFSDYMKPAIRLAALMNQQVIYIFTHDSIFVGEDGPTHQPIEQLTALRIIPNLLTIRPSDATETASAWKEALANKNGPTALILTRQNLPVIDREKYTSADNLRFGAYILSDCEGVPDLTILASGSEVSLSIDAGKEFTSKGVNVRIVSVPCMELFDKQSKEYRNNIIPSACKKITAIETGSSISWYKYTGKEGLIIGIDTFGASAKYNDLTIKFGFNTKSVINKINAKWNLI